MSIDPFQSVPNEVCQMIISYLPAQDRFSLAQTSQQMHAQVNAEDRVHHCSTRIIVVLSKMTQMLLNKEERPQLVEEQEDIGCEQIVRNAESMLKTLETRYTRAYKNQIEKPISIEQKVMDMFHKIVQPTNSFFFSARAPDDWLSLMQKLNVVEDQTIPKPSNYQSVCNNLKKYQEILSLTDLSCLLYTSDAADE